MQRGSHAACKVGGSFGEGTHGRQHRGARTGGRGRAPESGDHKYRHVGGIIWGRSYGGDHVGEIIWGDHVGAIMWGRSRGDHVRWTRHVMCAMCALETALAG